MGRSVFRDLRACCYDQVMLQVADLSRADRSDACVMIMVCIAVGDPLIDEILIQRCSARAGVLS